MTACIDDNAVLDFIQGRLDREQAARIDEHADACLSCRKAIDAAVRAFRERATGVDDGPLEITRFAVGDKLADRYRIVRFIARGGMGEVYEAEDEMLGTRIALKTIAATIADSPEAARRLKQEVNLARRITHPNVCRIFDLGVHTGGPHRAGADVRFITMELLPGSSLAQRLKEQGRFSTEAARPIVTAMAAALGAAHRAGVVHRDFKSDNVMIATDPVHGDRIVVTDFGLARNSSPSTQDSVAGRGLEGTLAYMSPEQLEGHAGRQPADIYALGLVMYEMLTGQLPFAPAEGGAWLPAAWRRAVEPIPPVQALVPGIDDRWSDVIAHCLQRDPARRPTDADAVVRALAAPALAPASVHATPPAAEVVSPPSPPRRGWPTAAAVGGLIVAGVAIFVVATATHRRPTRAAVADVAPAPALPVPATQPATAPTPPITPALPVVQRPTMRRPPGHRPVAAPARHDEQQAVAARPDAGAVVTTPERRRSTDPDDGFIFK